MNKEETLAYIKAYLNGDTAIGNIIPLRSVLESAIKYLEPSLSSNLDEAAQRIAYDVCKQLPNGEEKDGIVYYAILAAIAGAEWMAGQGITLECLIDYKSGALVGIDSVPTQETLKDYCNKIGASRVIVQIRKKQ